MKRFDSMLEEAVSSYKGGFSEIICEAPAFYRLMVGLLDDPNLPKPSDALPEDKYGPIGYIDDIFLCAFVADRVMKEAGSGDILVRNWDGKMPIVPLVK
jgi:hypothetical protein